MKEICSKHSMSPLSPNTWKYNVQNDQELLF